MPFANLKSTTMSAISLFEEKRVRRACNSTEEKWVFAIIDVISILTDSPNPQVYWRVLKKRLTDKGNETVTNCNGLKMTAADGNQRMTDVADTEQILRLIQSVPSPKAEPFKRWLTKVGFERLEEIAPPELAPKRMRTIYEQKGYSEDWIEKRLRGIAVRDELTEEWSKRGVKEGKEFGILTAEISKATFGMTPAQDKEFKALSNPKENLRDHITDLELIFTMLSEAGTLRSPKSATPKDFRKTNKPPKPEAPSLAMPAKYSRPRVATKSPPPKTTKYSPNQKDPSPAKNQTPEILNLKF